MQKTMTSWRVFLSDAKQAAKTRGDINGDADLAARVSEILESTGLPKVDRGAVNHWLKGRNPPSMAQFIALCSALSVSPAEALSGEVYGSSKDSRRHNTTPTIEDEVASLMKKTTDRGRAEIAFFARQTVERYPATNTNDKPFGLSPGRKVG